jgi:hypothetical protein
MVIIEKVDTQNKQQVKRFIDFHYNLYKGVPQWCPPFYQDMYTMLDRTKHPYYKHSDADFFLATRDGEIVGRIAALENKPFNKYHGTKDAEFYLFDTIDDQEVANALFNTVFEWARNRGLNNVVGQKGFSPFDGYGIQIEGFDEHQMMTMMVYNYPYYSKLVEALGFEKEVDFVSCYLDPKKYILPEKVRLVAERVLEKGTFKVARFKNKKELLGWVGKIAKAYNNTFIKNWEYYPLSDEEINYSVEQVLTIANPKLIKLITYNDDVIGFLFGFQDVTPALQRGKGKLNLFSIIDMLLELRRTKWIAMNGAGVLPEFHGRGGNALLYYEMEKTLHEFNFEHAELTQVAETTPQMRKDLINLGGVPYKNHRVYHKRLD